MRISDWSSSVCSSDVGKAHGTAQGWRPHRQIPGQEEDPLRLRHLRPWQRRAAGFALPCKRSGEAGVAAPRADGGSHGGWLFPRKSPAGRDSDLDRPWLGQPHHGPGGGADRFLRSEEHTSELQSLMRISYAVFCLKKNNNTISKKQR